MTIEKKIENTICKAKKITLNAPWTKGRSARHGIPTIYNAREYVQVGGLMATERA